MTLPPAPIRILAAAGVLALALVGLVVREGLARDQGTEVRLALAGYDPRSLLQGHYVQFQLRYDGPAGTPCPRGADGITRHPKSWVALKREGDHAPAGAGRTRAEAQRLGETVARGTLTCLGTRTTREVPGQPPETSPEVVSVMLNLGVDRIHLDQSQAEAIEAELRRMPPGGGAPGYAVLSIGRDGRARVKGLIVGRKRVDLDWF